MDPQETVSSIFPQACRLAITLCGDRPTGLNVSRHVLRRSGLLVDRWKDFPEGQRWFLRYTVLCTREHPPESSKNDHLFLAARSAEQQAIIVALRHLPGQQREAFILHHGEQLDLRQTATAMDCSLSAVKNHLHQATAALNEIAIGGIQPFVLALPEMMHQLTPDPDTVELEIKRSLRVRRRRGGLALLFKFLKEALNWLLLLAAIWALWTWRYHLRW
jgi:hypothetical protein